MKVQLTDYLYRDVDARHQLGKSNVLSYESHYLPPVAVYTRGKTYICLLSAVTTMVGSITFVCSRVPL